MLGHPGSFKHELRSRDKECTRCSPFIKFLKREVKEVRVKYKQLKFDNVNLIKKNSRVKDENKDLEVKVEALRKEIECCKMFNSPEYDSLLSSQQSSLNSLQNLERGQRVRALIERNNSRSNLPVFK
jgi:predicted nuclease with TOPRIM domain